MNDTEGHVDILVCMAGTGGTGFGTASYLRSRNPNLQVVPVSYTHLTLPTILLV